MLVVQDESFLAFVDMLVFVRAHPARVRRAGAGPRRRAGRDHSVEEVHRTARAYGTQAEIFPGMGHNMMLEAGWQTGGGPDGRLGTGDGDDRHLRRISFDMPSRDDH